MNYKELLEEKILNFKKFMSESFPDNELLEDYLKKINKMKVEALVLFIISELKPHKYNLDIYINKFITDNKLNKDKEKIKDETFEKIQKYLSCFIEIVEQL